jgi:hypothetical protein
VKIIKRSGMYSDASEWRYSPEGREANMEKEVNQLADALLEGYKAPQRIIDLEAEISRYKEVRCPTTCTIQIDRDRYQSELEKMVELLRLILPMAKGYAYKNDVGSNVAYIDAVEQFLAGGKDENKV